MVGERALASGKNAEHRDLCGDRLKRSLGPLDCLAGCGKLASGPPLEYKGSRGAARRDRRARDAASGWRQQTVAARWRRGTDGASEHDVWPDPRTRATVSREDFRVHSAFFRSLLERPPS
jgi:hypothetical protein